MIHSDADVDVGCEVGTGTTVWAYAHLRAGAVVGEDCVVGRGAYIGAGVLVGDQSKIQNYALLYEPAALGRGVFIGPGVIFTNDQYPRAVNPDMSLKSASDWEPAGVNVGNGASIGAGAICVAPVRIGNWALIAAGAVVTRNVPDFAVVVGSPARRVGWVGRSGARLQEEEGRWVCPVSGESFVEENDVLAEVMDHVD